MTILTVSCVFAGIYILSDLLYSLRNAKYQNLWNKEKANIIRIDPAVTRAELCEKYVRFCKKNQCKVDY